MKNNAYQSTIIRKIRPIPFQTSELQNFFNALEILKDASILYAGSMTLLIFIFQKITHKT